MTINEAITWATTHVYESANVDDIVSWLWRLDVRIYRELIAPREGGENYEEPTEYTADERGRNLLLPVPYDELYHAYLEYHLRRRLGEDGKAGDASELYNALLDDFRRAYIRNHSARIMRFSY